MRACGVNAGNNRLTSLRRRPDVVGVLCGMTGQAYSNQSALSYLEQLSPAWEGCGLQCPFQSVCNYSGSRVGGVLWRELNYVGVFPEDCSLTAWNRDGHTSTRGIEPGHIRAILRRGVSNTAHEMGQKY